MALRSMAMQLATVAGPALGGFIFYLKPELPYAVAGGLMVLAFACVLGLRSQSARAGAESGGSPDWESLLAGVGFVRRTPVLLGAISLDLFAVLFGGAIALLPSSPARSCTSGRAAWVCCGRRPRSGRSWRA